jgi:hypothetical protein
MSDKYFEHRRSNLSPSVNDTEPLILRHPGTIQLANPVDEYASNATHYRLARNPSISATVRFPGVGDCIAGYQLGVKTLMTWIQNDVDTEAIDSLIIINNRSLIIKNYLKSRVSRSVGVLQLATQRGSVMANSATRFSFNQP